MIESEYNEKDDTVTLTYGRHSRITMDFYELASITEEMREKHIERNNRLIG